MDNEMIERCANVLDEKDFNLNALERDQIVMIVIKAMREPTEKMADEGWYTTAGLHREDAIRCWQNIIGSVINE